MTTVEINRSGTDVTSLDIFQTGSHESSVSLRHDLLDAKLHYHFAVTSLSVPLNESPIFKLSAPLEIFRIERRDVGASVNEDLSLHTPGNAAQPVTVGRLTIRPNVKFFDVSSFVKQISNIMRGFNQYWTLAGFNPAAGGYSGVGNALPARTQAEIEVLGTEHGVYQFVQVRLTADGTLQLVGSNIFWNNFVFRFTRAGSAILGYFNQIQEVVRQAPAAATHFFIAKSLVGGAFTNDWLDETAGHVGEILLGNMVQEAKISSDHPIYQSCDQRIKVSVETHIPMASNISIVDEQESIDRSIAEAYFESKLENTIRFDETGILENLTMQSVMYAGQTNFIKKSDRSFQWNRLLTAYELKLFRFQIYIHYRVWNDATQRWVLEKNPLTVPDQQFWELAVRFVSDS